MCQSQISGSTKDHFTGENEVCEISQTHKKGCKIASQQKADFAALRSWLSACGVRLATCCKYRETSGRIPQHCAKNGCEIISQQKGDFITLCKILPSAWSDCLAMVVTPSFQLWIVHRLKHWIVDFLSFKTTYSMHKLDSRKCSKSGWNDCHQECFMADFLFASPPCIPDCLWQRTLKLQSFGSLHCFAKDSK